MNLEYAAYLLTESHILSEDANSSGIDKTKKWVKKNYHLTELGQEAEDEVVDDQGMPIRMQDRITHEERNQRNIDNIVETARTFFGHWLGNQLRVPRQVRREDGTMGPNNASGIYKYLPGAVRVAISDCGWFTAHPNHKMLENLRYLYAYAWDEWQTGLVEGLPGPQRGQPYAGKLNADFNGKSYQQLMNEFGSQIPAIKAKIQENGGPGTEYDAEERQAAEVPAPVDHSPYHIELIENYRQAHEWYDYTNPTADQAGNHFAGARWCIAEYNDHWDHYMNHFGRKKPTVYFCWKAASKEALLAMNEHVADYDIPGSDDRDERGYRKDDQLPFSEYGLSLICVMVTEGDRPGDVKFLQATSRYNHCNSHGEKRMDGDPHAQYYGDNLCRDGGKRKICEILGMSSAEFDRRLKPVNGGGGTASHDNIMDAVDNLSDILYIADSYDKDENVGLYRISHNDEYNCYDMYTHKFISDSWFRECQPFSDNGFSVVQLNNGKWNIINARGEFMIDVDVDSIEYNSSRNENYAKVGINKGGDMFYNIVRVDSGRPLLRRLYKDAKLLPSFGNTISVLDSDNKWKLVDVKGKVVGTLPENMEIYKETSKLMCLKSRTRSGYYKIVSKKNNKEIAKITGSVGRINTCKDGCIVVKKEDDKFNLYTENGPVFDTWINRIAGYESYGKQIYFYTQGRTNGFVTSKGRKVETDGSEIDDAAGGVIKCGEKFYNLEGDELSLPENAYLDDGDYNVTVVKDGDYYKFLNVLTGEFIDLGGANITGYINRHEGYFINTHDNKTNYIDAKTCEVISDTFFDNCKINPIGQNCYLLDKGGNRLNIFNADFGEELFDMDFTELKSRFSQNGLAFIKCNRSDFVINTHGDVSRSVELIAENIRMYRGAENFLVETVKPRPINKFFMNAAYLLD